MAEKPDLGKDIDVELIINFIVFILSPRGMLQMENSILGVTTVIVLLNKLLLLIVYFISFIKAQDNN